jgi:hypothetical protein
MKEHQTRVWVYSGEQTIGPFTLPQILALCSERIVAGREKAQIVGEQEWYPLDTQLERLGYSTAQLSSIEGNPSTGGRKQSVRPPTSEERISFVSNGKRRLLSGKLLAVIAVSLLTLFGVLSVYFLWSSSSSIPDSNNPNVDQANTNLKVTIPEIPNFDAEKILSVAKAMPPLYFHEEKGMIILYLYNKDKIIPYTGWMKGFHDNGVLGFLASYANGVPDGPFWTWYENGLRRQEAVFKNGKKNGIETTWHENGQPKSFGGYADGLFHGIGQIYYPSGNKKIRGLTVYGKQQGLWISYNEDGTEKLRKIFKDGKEVVD